ncbi:MAG TPA: hypothetical protein VNF29_10165, partial [Candidatus Binataceae bacterium]|nr:hypothetical protein [Candidatus Binataceae bacterium]
VIARRADGRPPGLSLAGVVQAPVLEWAATIMAAGVLLAGIEAILWPQWDDTLLGFVEALGMAALTVWLVVRAATFVVGRPRFIWLSSPWLEITTASFLAHVYWRTGLASLYAWGLNIELTDFEEWCLFIMLGIAIERLWWWRRRRRGL